VDRHGHPVAGRLRHQPEPDQRLAAHLEDLCEIARARTSRPERGVKRLGAYLAKNLGSITGRVRQHDR